MSAPVTDRHESLRQRIGEVEAAVEAGASEVSAAQSDFDAAVDALAAARAAVTTAEQQLRRATGRRDAIVAEQQAREGELGSLRRRLSMGTLVREARA